MAYKKPCAWFDAEVRRTRHPGLLRVPSRIPRPYSGGAPRIVVYPVLALALVSFAQIASAADLTLAGDTSCSWGSKDCNRCVNDVRANFDSIETDYKGKLGSRIGVRSYAYPSRDYLLHRINALGYEHIQGVGRIAGLGNDEYLVFTHSTKSTDPGKSGALAVVRMGASQESNGHALGDMRDGDGKDQDTRNRTVARTFSDSNHPGGLATLGHHVFVADWCQPHPKGPEGREKPYQWCDSPSQYAFEVYDVSNVHRNAVINSHPPIRIIDRSVKVPGDEKRQGSTASVAATRLEDGHYLVGIGRSGGKNYEYYLSDTTRLLPSTVWTSLGDPEPIGKWGENAAMVNECGTGVIYLFQIEKSADNPLDGKQSKDEVHLFRLIQVPNTTAVKHQYVTSRNFKCSDGTAWCDFDKGGGLYISPEGNLYLYATDAQQAKSTGRFRMVEFGNYLETTRRNEEAPSRRDRPDTVDHRQPGSEPPSRDGGISTGRGRPIVVDHREPNTETPRRNEPVPANRGTLPPPSEVTISEVGRTSLRLDWMDNATMEYGVSVERGMPVEDRGGINYHWMRAFNVEERIMTRVQGTGWRTGKDDRLETGTNYCYRLRAYHKDHYSPYSPRACARTSP